MSSVLWAIDSWLKESDPELLNDLLPPAQIEELQDLTDCVGRELPYSFCELYMFHNGQASAEKLLFPDWYFMPLLGGGKRGAVEQYSYFKDVGFGRSDEFVKPVKSSTLWIPFATDFYHNFLGIDLDPTEMGKMEQVICFGRGKQAHKVADSLVEFLLGVATRHGVSQSLLKEAGTKSWTRDNSIPPQPGMKVNIFAQSREESIRRPGEKPALRDNVVEFKPGIRKGRRNPKQVPEGNKEEPEE